MTPELRAASERAAQVITADGRLLRGARACLFVLEGLGWGWLARLLAHPPFIWLAEFAYRILANHRAFFARFMFRRE